MPSSTHSLDLIVEAAIKRLGTRASASDVEVEAVRIMERRAPVSPSVPIRSICVSVSLASSTSRRSATQFARVYDNLRLALDSFQWDVAEALNLSASNSLPCPLHLHVRQTGNLFVGHAPTEILSVATSLSRLAQDVGLDRVTGPFLDLSHPDNLSQVEIIPELLSLHPAIHPVIQIGTREQGLDADVIRALCLALSIRGQNRPSAEAGSAGATIIVNGCDQRAFGHRVHPQEVLFSMDGGSPDSNPAQMGVFSEIAEIAEIAAQVVQIGAVADRRWRFARSEHGQPAHAGSPVVSLDQPHQLCNHSPISCDSLTDSSALENELTRQLSAWNHSGMTGWTDITFPVR